MTLTPSDQLNALLSEHVNYWDHDHRAAVHAVIAEGWRPPPRVITTVDALDTLPVGVVVVDECETVWRRGEISWFACARRPDGPARIALPVTVLHEPEVAR